MAGRGLNPEPSLIVDEVSAPLQLSGWHRLPAWIGIAVTTALFLLFATLDQPIDDPHISSLDGVWQASVAPGVAAPTTVTLPGSFRAQGLPIDRPVYATRDLVTPGGPMALYLDEPRYAVSITWDGAPIASRGDPMGSARSSLPVLVMLPTSGPQETHRIGLEIRGDFGDGGLRGHVLIGPPSLINAAALTWRVRALATAIGLAMLGSLPLLVASRGPSRPAYTAFGLAVTSLAVLLWVLTPYPESSGWSVVLVLRIQRAAFVLLAVFEVLFFSAFVRGVPGRLDAGALVVGALGFTAAMVCPPSALFHVRLLSDATALAGLVVCLMLVVEGFQRRVSGRWLLGLGAAAIVAGTAYELSLAFGLQSSGSDLLPLSLVMMVSQGAALLMRDAAASERHERLLKLSPDALVAVDPEGRIHDANPAARALLPTGVDSHVLRLVSTEHRPRVRAHIQRAQLRPDRAEFRDSTGRWWESSATPLAVGRVLLTLRDISARREMDRGMLHAARAETAGLLMGGIAHDFNNMLGTLLAHVGILRRAEADRPAIIERLGRMEGSIERAASLTRRLLTVSRGTGSPLSVADLGEVCRGAVDLVEPTLPPGVVLLAKIEPDLPPVHGDASDLEQVIVNLLVNARDAIGEHGQIELHARRFALDDGSRGVAVMVQDNGPGVPDDLVGEIFQPFVTTKRQGTGLGLAVARQILSDHLGRLWHERAPGGGARFLLALRHADVMDLAPAPLPNARRLLLVDDEEILLEAWESALADAGYDVVSTSSPERALEHLRSAPPDLLVTDLLMEPLGGLDLAAALHAIDPDVPVLVVSAFISTDVQKTLDAHGWSALTKPVRAARLVSSVGHLRRRAERIAAGQDDITSVIHLFPTLEALSSDTLGFGQPEQP